MKKSDIYKMALTAMIKEIANGDDWNADEIYYIVKELSGKIDIELYNEKKEDVGNA